MHIQTIRTHKIQPQDQLEDILSSYFRNLQEGDVVAITSKIISILEGRFVPQAQTDKLQLIHQEADLILDTNLHPYGIQLTIKHGILIPSSGIDASNGPDQTYILYPKNPQKTAHRIWQYLKTWHQLEHLGVILTDSHTTPLRRGVTGIGLAWCGFVPNRSYVGEPDLYGRPLQFTHINVLDALAASAVLMMGEGKEQTPLALIRGAPHLSFLDRPPNSEDITNLKIPLSEDLYAPFLDPSKWKTPEQNIVSKKSKNDESS